MLIVRSHLDYQDQVNHQSVLDNRYLKLNIVTVKTVDYHDQQLDRQFDQFHIITVCAIFLVDESEFHFEVLVVKSMLVLSEIID